MTACRICGVDLDDEIYRVREMHFGTREVFEYQQCSQCGCLQIAEIPKDLGQYYPGTYYSKHLGKEHCSVGLLSVLRQAKLNAVLRGKAYLSGALFFLKKPSLSRWLAYSQLHSRSRILDVGCGAGKLLLKLSKKGFRELVGVDPLIDQSIRYSCGIQIFKEELWELAEDIRQAGSFDVVMMHHSLEHIPDQHRTIESACSLLKKEGILVVRIPISSSWAWANYRENWVQLDAPRHLYLHSANSIESLARMHGLVLRELFYDSTEFQFTGSERYISDIALNEGGGQELFSRAQIAEFRLRAEGLNREETGDQACFVFSVKGSSIEGA